MKFKHIFATGMLSALALASNMQNIEATSLFGVKNSNEIDANIEFNDNDININDKYDDLMKQFEKMTDSELNQYITYVMNQNTQIRKDTISYSSDTSLSFQKVRANVSKSSSASVETAWLAAAEILSNHGYKCTGTLITCSVKGINYIESCSFDTNGLFSSKIVNTSVFKSYFSKLKKGKKVPQGLEFTKSDNNDLYLALHNTDISSEVRLPNTNFTTYHFNITDTYDFKKSNYEDVMVGLVNNFAWLCQNTGVLKNINIKIYFMK